MTYTFNPHRHVKIWLSIDPNSFMNFENQLRLVKMREQNKTDEISLVYDSSLLSEQARKDIMAFATKHNIKLVDVVTDVIPKTTMGLEKSLIEKYQMEVSQLKNGGNVGRASDILRWLSPVYSRGIYSDFDLDIDTNHLPATMQVDAPILLNVGSTRTKLAFKTFECPAPNNDVIAVVDSNGPSGRESIIKIQEQLVKAYAVGVTVFNIFGPVNTSPFGEYSKHYQQTLRREMGEITGNAFLARTAATNPASVLNILDSYAINKSLPQLHKYIQDLTAADLINSSRMTKDAYVKLVKKAFKPSFFAWLFLPKKKYKALKDIYNMKDQDAFLDVYLSQFKLYMLKNLVVYATGPGALYISMFPKIAYSVDSFRNTITPYSMQTYDLLKAFKSKNSVSLNVSPKELKSLNIGEVGDVSDLSWLQEGIDARKIREFKMKISASKIQRLFKNKIKSINEEKLDHVRENINNKLTDIQSKIQKEVKSIQSDLNGCFGFYNREKRIARMTALKGVLGHYNDKTFNTVEFHKNRSNYHLSTKPDGFWKSRTQAILNELVSVSMQENLYSNPRTEFKS